MSYADAIKTSKLDLSSDRPSAARRKLFEDAQDRGQKLHSLIPKKKSAYIF